MVLNGTPSQTKDAASRHHEIGFKDWKPRTLTFSLSSASQWYIFIILSMHHTIIYSQLLGKGLVDKSMTLSMRPSGIEECDSWLSFILLSKLCCWSFLYSSFSSLPSGGSQIRYTLIEYSTVILRRRSCLSSYLGESKLFTGCGKVELMLYDECTSQIAPT